MDFYVDMAFAVMFRLLQSPQQQKVMRKAFLKLFRTLHVVYASDPDFKGACNLEATKL